MAIMISTSVSLKTTLTCKGRGGKYPAGRRTLFTGLLFLLLLGMPLALSAEEARLHDLSGTERSLDEFHGKWIVVNYWATWCAPCIEEIPELNALYEAHKLKDLVVIGINSEGLSPSLLKIFMEEQSVVYPVWMADPYSEPWPGPVIGIPTTFLISPQGKVVAKQAGKVSRAMIERFISSY